MKPIAECVRVGVLIIALCAGSAGYAQVVHDSGARIDGFHVLLLDVMRAQTGYPARVEALSPGVLDLFDLQRISRVSLGRTWRDLDPGAREAFQVLLGRLIVATYADRFAEFSGQQFIRDDVVNVGGGEVVKTRLLRENGDAVSLDYYVRDGRIFNVVADGVSDLSLRKADYAAIIEREGYEGLLAYIQESLDAYAQ